MSKLIETHVRVFPILHSDYTQPGDKGYGNDTPWRWMAMVTVFRRNEHFPAFLCRRGLTRRRAFQWAAKVYAKESTK